MKTRILVFFICLLPLPSVAATLDIVPVQSGIFKKENCTPEEKCLCTADMNKAVVSGIPTEATQKINDTLTRPYGNLDVDMEPCEGNKVNLNIKDTIEYRSSSYKIILDKSSFLTIQLSYGGYYSEAAHPFFGEVYYFFNTKTGNRYSYRDLFGSDLKALNIAIKDYLQSHKKDISEMGREDNGEEVFEEEKESLDNGLIGADWIDRTAYSVFLSKKGLIFIFNAGKYISSDVEVVLPVKVIKNNEVRKYVESLHTKAIK